MVLITGGVGYIGSHISCVLAKIGMPFILLDDFSNSSHDSLEKLKLICDRKFIFIHGNVGDETLLDRIFEKFRIQIVIHLAAHKSVPASYSDPLSYYQNNVVNVICLLSCMKKAGVSRFIFSSSAAIYGGLAKMPLSESAPISPISPYGRTKLITELLLQDMVISEPNYWRVVSLRYFNPIGAYDNGLIGEAVTQSNSNLTAQIGKVAAGFEKFVCVWGGDYSTPDGTCIRDFIHVMDLAEGHISAIQSLDRLTGFHAVNLGTGRGVSVLEMITAYEKASGKKIPYEIRDRRAGDMEACWADVTLADRLLNWRAKRGVQEMCNDDWSWRRNLINKFLNK